LRLTIELSLVPSSNICDVILNDRGLSDSHEKKQFEM